MLHMVNLNAKTLFFKMEINGCFRVLVLNSSILIIIEKISTQII